MYTESLRSHIVTDYQIRFAAPPTGNLRWAMPAPPAFNGTLSDGKHGNQCVQPVLFKKEKMRSKTSLPINSTDVGDEDCLFLDVYVPGTVLRNKKQNIPVVVWVHGGGYC